MAAAKKKPAALAIVPRDPAELKPDPRNAKKHPEQQIRLLRDFIDRLGFLAPVAVGSKDLIKAGHGRWEAAMLDPPMPLVPTVDISWLSEKAQREYMLADNKLAELAAYDKQLLSLEAADLAGSGVDLAALGFSTSELSLLLDKGGGKTDPDEAPPVPAKPKAKRGDLYVLGNHRLLCGDSTDAADVKRALGSAKPHLMVTDPPYGVNYDPEWRNKAARNSTAGMGNRKIGAGAVGVVLNDDRADWTAAWSLFPGAVAYVWHGALHGVAVAASLESAKLMVRSQIVWVKTRFAIGRGDYHWQHEPAFYAVRGKDDKWADRFVPEHELATYVVKAGEAGAYVGGRKQSTVWMIEVVKNDTGHSTQKPVECMRRPIENNSKEGDFVYDPFAGSSTTMIACEMTGRRCIGIELNPAYIDVGVERWEKFTGKKAVLEHSPAPTPRPPAGGKKGKARQG